MTKTKYNYRTLEDLTSDDIELLMQAMIRLRAEGALSLRWKWEDLLDAVLARGEFTDTKTDYMAYEAIMGEENG